MLPPGSTLTESLQNETTQFAVGMALVGELWRARPYAAFAHLKFTSGVASFAGFLLLPRLPLRTAALVTLGVQVLGAVGFALFLLLCTGLLNLSLCDIAADEAQLPSSVNLINKSRAKRSSFIKGKSDGPGMM